MDSKLKIENEIVDGKKIVSIIEERLGNISRIKNEYEIIIMPNKAQADGDILNPTTALIRNFARNRNIKVGVAVKEPHKYTGSYSDDIILPTLIFIGTNIGLNILSSFLYDKYFKNTIKPTHANVHLDYMELNNESTTFKRTTIKGNVSDVMRVLETLRTSSNNDNTKK